MEGEATVRTPDTSTDPVKTPSTAPTAPPGSRHNSGTNPGSNPGGGGGHTLEHTPPAASTKGVGTAAAATATAPFSSAAATLALQLAAKSEKLEEELRLVEGQVYDLETAYLQDANQIGSVLRGFDAFLSARNLPSNTKRTRRFQTDDRLFSLSSATSLATEERAALREAEQAKSDGGAAVVAAGQAGPSQRVKAASFASTPPVTPSSGPGKQQSAQKRGRSVVAPREGKKLRQASEQASEDSDDETQTWSLA